MLPTWISPTGSPPIAPAHKKTFLSSGVVWFSTFSSQIQMTICAIMAFFSAKMDGISPLSTTSIQIQSGNTSLSASPKKIAPWTSNWLWIQPNSTSSLPKKQHRRSQQWPQSYTRIGRTLLISTRSPEAPSSEWNRPSKLQKGRKNDVPRASSKAAGVPGRQQCAQSRKTVGTAKLRCSRNGVFLC